MIPTESQVNTSNDKVKCQAYSQTFGGGGHKCFQI